MSFAKLGQFFLEKVVFALELFDLHEVAAIFVQFVLAGIETMLKASIQRFKQR
jgi:hypothetical protein